MAMSKSDITFDEIRDYFIKNGGKVSNRDLVKHFKHYLTHTQSKEDARIKFKEYVNQLATTKTENNEKFLTIRKRFVTSPAIVQSPSRQPPPYRPPPEVKSPTPSTESIRDDDVSLDNVSQCSDYSLRSDSVGTGPPQAPPRRKSQEKMKLAVNQLSPDDSIDKVTESSDNEQKVSVRERTQKFNRLASETDVKQSVVVSPSSSSSSNKKKTDKIGGNEDEDRSSVSLEMKGREWIVKAAKADYQGLAKLISENPRLVNYKDSFAGYTALHWAAKHGNEDIVKLLAGTYKADVNVRTNGGYTPLHIAIQFAHNNVYDLLVNVYKADPQTIDWSGRKPLAYVQTTKQSVSNETFRSKYDNNQLTANSAHDYTIYSAATLPASLRRKKSRYTTFSFRKVYT